MRGTGRGVDSRYFVNLGVRVDERGHHRDWSVGRMAGSGSDFLPPLFQL